MSVRRVGNRWQVRLRVGGGKRIERTLPPGASRNDALAVENTIRRAQIDILAGRKPDYPIDAALDRWLSEEVRHQKSAQRTRQRVNVLREFTKGKSLKDLQAVASQLKTADAKPATINRYLSVLRRIGNLAEEWGLVDRAPKITLLEERNERHVYLTAEEVESLARACRDPEVGDFIRLAALTGLRRSELLGLKKIDGAFIRLDARTKTGRPRAIPLTREALRIAQDRIPWTIDAGTLRREFERARKALGRPDWHLHDLRHSFASFIVQGTGNMKLAKELLGHTTMAMTDRYAHLSGDHRETLAALEKFSVRKVGKTKSPKSGRMAKR
jgi:integrase